MTLQVDRQMKRHRWIFSDRPAGSVARCDPEELVEVLRPQLDTVNAIGHDVIVAALALRVFEVMPELCTKAVGDGLARVIHSCRDFPLAVVGWGCDGRRWLPPRWNQLVGPGDRRLVPLRPMLVTITSTVAPATDLGFLLHKNPGALHERELAFGVARVVYPEATDERCTAALIVDIDPVALVRGRKGGPRGNGFALSQYVNDRPYAASSFLAVAMSKMFSTAMGGRSKDRPELARHSVSDNARLPRRRSDLVRVVAQPRVIRLALSVARAGKGIAARRECRRTIR